ncbi:hypothetical protein [Planctomicrobium sp. SH664]|uniref:hypothetical protein n=1 Tax=Planctomicrobium sp. SH664 TaxID=3448125 RepID=UPI003F5BA503
MRTSHRKRRWAINEPGHTHFFTFSGFRRWPLLHKDRSQPRAIDSLQQLRGRQQVAL